MEFQNWDTWFQLLETINSTRRFEEFYTVTSVAVSRVFDVELANIAILNPESDTFTLTELNGPEGGNGARPATLLPVSKSYLGMVVQAGRPVIWRLHGASDADFSGAGFSPWLVEMGLNASLHAPIVMSGETIGILNLASEVEDRFGPAEKEYARILATIMACGLAAHRLKAPQTQTRRGATDSILLAEDNPMNQKLITRMLTTLGHAVVLAENGRIALEKFRQGSFSAVIMDIKMPEMDGYDATRRIRAMDREVWILGVSGNPLEHQRQLALECGMNTFLPKPFSLSQLDEMLQLGGVGNFGAAALIN